MNILIFSTAYLPFIGGAELAIKEITERLPDRSFSLITACMRHGVPPRERIGNVEVYRVGFGTRFDKWLLPWLGLRKAKQLEKEKHFEVMWSMMASQASIPATWFKKLHPSKRLVLTLQEGDEEAHLKRYVFGNEFLYKLLIHPWYVGVFRQADVITAISNYLAKRAQRHSSARVEVIPNGVDLNSFQLLGSSFQGREDLRKRLGLRDDDRVIITTSRLVKKNGIADLIQSLQYLPEQIKLLIVGGGELEQQLRLETRSLKLEARVKFLGFVAHAELPSYLHASDVFCRPSLSEGMGSSFIEAMAAGLPVIATPVGGIPDFLSDGETGLFCEVNNPKSIAEKVKLLFSDNDLRRRIVANASQLVREKYRWDMIAKQMGEVFQQTKT